MADHRPRSLTGSAAFPGIRYPYSGGVCTKAWRIYSGLGQARAPGGHPEMWKLPGTKLP